jgi:hypothetical protein
VLRRAAVAAAGVCLLVLVASAGAETTAGTTAAGEPAAIADATTAATGQIVSISEGIGLADATDAVSGARVSVGESVALDDATAAVTGQLVGVAETLGISDGIDTAVGRLVQVGEGLAIADDTDAVALNAPPVVLVAELNGDEGAEATAIGSFTDSDHGPWTAEADYGDGTPPEPVAVAAGKSFTVAHVYDDDGAYLLTVTVTDATGAEGTATAAVSIDNVAPTATLAGASGDEGAPIALSFTDQLDPSEADTAAGFTYRYACDGVTFGPVTSDAATTCTYDDNGTYTVLARIADKDGGASERTAHLIVGNVAPTATLANDGPTVEGAPATVAWSAQSDPSAADTAAGFTYRFACDGTTLGAATTSATTSCTFADDGTYTVLARIADKDGGTTDRTTDVVVNNAPPTGVLSNDGPIVEGSSATVAWSAQSDPSPADTAAGFTYRYACDGVTLGPATASASTTCSFDDGPGTHTVLARIADVDGGYTDRTTDVTVANAPPSATLSNNGPVAEGSPATISFSAQTDPSSADVAAGFTYRYACDGALLGPPTADPTATCTFDDGPSTHTVLARITDKDGGFADRTTAVSVTNVAPTGRLQLPASPVEEGSSFTLAVADLTDPSAADTAAGFTVEFDCGGGFGPSATCTALDDPAHAVKARVADKDGGQTILTGSVPVANVAPSVTITAPAAGSLYQVGQAVTFSGTFSDPGAADTHTASWAFDGAAREGTVTESTDTVSLVSSFSAPGVYSVTLTVTDDDGGAGTATTVDGLPAFVVVYDASAGFVTGGGWINSPAGAYAPSPAATGKATFGFVAKYKPGANAPDGNTEFNFKAGGFDFRSTGYDWLVVAGSKAQYRGTGTVNGSAGYGFLLTAYDDSTDRIRLKVWDASNTVVYDNRRGSSDDVDTADPQALGGGSIVVHRK